jgi:DMSO/TMAO reductase YedYZ molybdopterin-dependent catalytic subunit
LPNGKVLPLSIDDLKEKFEVIEMPVTLMCAGNRRSEFNAQVKDKKVNVRT